MTPCIGQPISHWKLERYQLNELRAAETQAIDAHLQACEVCRACLTHARHAPELPELLALPVQSRAPSRMQSRVKSRSPFERVRKWFAPLEVRGAFGLLVAAAAIALMLRSNDGPGHEPPFIPGARLDAKGGELAIELVRQHRGSLADPRRFAAGDAFKVLITCPQRERMHVDVVVYQGGETFFPLPSTQLDSCGNRRNLQGAFALDGAHDAVVCAVISSHALPPSLRAQLARGPGSLERVRDQSVCQRVEPVHEP